MSDLRDDYMKFNIDGDSSSNGSFMSTVIKALIVLLLLLGVIVLGAIGYKFLFKGETKVANSVAAVKPAVTNQDSVEQKVTNAVKASSSNIKQEEIAAIVKNVLAQMKQPIQTKQQQPQQVVAIQTTDSPAEVDDAELLNNLQSTNVDSTKNEDIDLSGLDGVDTKKEVNTKVKKQADNFNKVIIKKDNVATKDDLAKLYAKLNTIMQKDQAKAKKSSYTKMISGETKVRANEMRLIAVKKGDTLSKIAFRAYGDAMMYTKIYEANPDIVKNPNLIFVGQKLRVPK